MNIIYLNYFFCVFENGVTIYIMSEFNIDFKSNKTTKPFLRKGQGKRMSNLKSHINYEYLKKGEGKLASHNRNIGFCLTYSNWCKSMPAITIRNPWALTRQPLQKENHKELLQLMHQRILPEEFHAMASH